MKTTTTATTTDITCEHCGYERNHHDSTNCACCGECLVTTKKTPTSTILDVDQSGNMTMVRWVDRYCRKYRGSCFAYDDGRLDFALWCQHTGHRLYGRSNGDEVLVAIMRSHGVLSDKKEDDGAFAGETLERVETEEQKINR